MRLLLVTRAMRGDEPTPTANHLILWQRLWYFYENFHVFSENLLTIAGFGDSTDSNVTKPGLGAHPTEKARKEYSRVYPDISEFLDTASSEEIFSFAATALEATGANAENLDEWKHRMAAFIMLNEMPPAADETPTTITTPRLSLLRRESRRASGAFFESSRRSIDSTASGAAQLLTQYDEHPDGKMDIGEFRKLVDDLGVKFGGTTTTTTYLSSGTTTVRGSRSNC